MTQRVGSVKWTVILLLGTAIILLCMVVGAWYIVRELGEQNMRRMQEIQKEAQKKMRADEAENIKRMVALVGKGGAYVSGMRFSASGGMESMSILRQQKGEETTCSIPWSVPPADFARIADGMTVEEVRIILDLSALHYIPNGPRCRFILQCDRPNRKVTLVFAGDPEVKLVSKLAEGAD